MLWYMRYLRKRTIWHRHHIIGWLLVTIFAGNFAWLAWIISNRASLMDPSELLEAALSHQC